jgi:hypothetical protein
MTAVKSSVVLRDIHWTFTEQAFMLGYPGRR